MLLYLNHSLVKLFLLSLSNSTFHSRKKPAIIHLCWKRRTLLNSQNIILSSFNFVLSKVYEAIFKGKIWKHLRTLNLISDLHNDIRKKCSIGNLLPDLCSSTYRILVNFMLLKEIDRKSSRESRFLNFTCFVSILHSLLFLFRPLYNSSPSFINL